MKLGTKSVLFGAHAFFLHPFFVAWGWWKLYGFPWDPRLWVAFFVHDLGYIGKPNMDGEEGERHPMLGAVIMTALFDRRRLRMPFSVVIADPPLTKRRTAIGEWGQFAMLHSRYFAKRYKLKPSPLCMADKLAIALTPAWLYLPMVRATGELAEYMDLAHRRAASGEALTQEERTESTAGDAKRWYAAVQQYAIRYVEAHKDGRDDTWTSSAAQGKPDTKAGVWP